MFKNFFLLQLAHLYLHYCISQTLLPNSRANSNVILSLILGLTKVSGYSYKLFKLQTYVFISTCKHPNIFKSVKDPMNSKFKKSSMWKVIISYQQCIESDTPHSKVYPFTGTHINTKTRVLKTENMENKLKSK